MCVVFLSFCHADTTHICQWHTIQFTDDSFENVSSWQWQFPGGEPAWSDEQNPAVKYHQSGVYDVILTISDGVLNQTMHKKEYIHVKTCAGVDEKSVPEKNIRLYPNPARDLVWVEFDDTLQNEVSIGLYNLQGTLIRDYTIAGHRSLNNVSLDISGISEGMYIIQVISRNGATSGKLIIFE